VRWAQPAEQCSHTLGEETRSNGRRPEPVLGAGERADRADLHRVAGEVGVERLLGVDPDLLGRRALHQVDELVSAISSENRVQRWHSTHRSRSSSTWLEMLHGLGVLALVLAEAAVGPAGRHRLVLQWTLAALVAHGAVEGWLMSSSSMIPSCAFLATGR
jgi:hypothetical protein